MFKLPKNLDSKYRFTTLAALRAEQLQVGARPRVESKHRKATLIAQEEVAEGLVEPWEPGEEGDEAAQEEAGREV